MADPAGRTSAHSLLRRRLSENAISPRFGVTVTVPRLRWTFRGFYGHFYQAPPLLTASGPLEQFCTENGCSFLPLHGERDEEFQFGVDHSVSRMDSGHRTPSRPRQQFLRSRLSSESPTSSSRITIQEALIRGWELTLRSPRIAHRGQVHLAYSNQVADGGGAITGGLTDGTTNLCDPDPGLCPLDHDQRNTLNVGGTLLFPGAPTLRPTSTMDRVQQCVPGHPYPGSYLPGHTTFDLSVGKDFGERYSASLNGVNVANRRVELDNSTTFGGFHWNNPREIFVEMRFRFHY